MRRITNCSLLQAAHVLSVPWCFDQLWESCNGSAAIPDENAKDKCCRFDGHVSVLRHTGIQADEYQDRSHWHRGVGRLLHARSSGLETAGYPESRHFLSLLCACVTFVLAGIPTWHRPRRWSNGRIFFPAIFGSITKLKIPHVEQALPKCSFWPGNSWKSAKLAGFWLCSCLESLWWLLYNSYQYLQTKLQLTENFKPKTHTLKHPGVIWMQRQHKNSIHSTVKD